ncbi:hypothetical protein [Hydrogenophaga sp. SL48]|uniref:hypothetical protein n=1 Tax=Hydrogenophaga sp. SL48 TaxID=2806347 RepID=UPI001F30A5BC|nr:hypothetical protein [Hydrogenophaga sp. SL48]UJW79632.1 hypothetical protein IM738_17320 [Hydrogenophaga sp. SL48]
MPLYEITRDSLTPIAQKTFTELGFQERANIQRAVRAHIAAITPGVRTMVLAEEFGDWVGANRRIDLLCLDEEARLVVVELKREDGAHMELQALRYAAMVSTMRFDQAVEAHRKYLKSMGSSEDPEQAIRDFLEIEDGQVALSEEVRIVLAASDFPQELTTTVLWLNKQGLDIRCVQMRPHLVDQRVLIDIQQVIPLPEAEQYQVAVREKSMEQAAARPSSRDWTRFDLVIGDQIFTNLPKRRLIYEVVKEALRRGLTPSQIGAAVPWRESTIFLSADGQLDSLTFQSVGGEKSLARYYSADEDIFHIGGKTYAFSTQWGSRTREAIDNINKLMPEGAPVTYAPTTKVVDEVTYGEHVIRQRENGSIEVERNGVPMQPVKPVLRELAMKLQLLPQNGRGNDLNTRQLGAQVVRAVKEL